MRNIFQYSYCKCLCVIYMYCMFCKTCFLLTNFLYDYSYSPTHQGTFFVHKNLLGKKPDSDSQSIHKKQIIKYTLDFFLYFGIYNPSWLQSLCFKHLSACTQVIICIMIFHPHSVITKLWLRLFPIMSVSFK